MRVLQRLAVCRDYTEGQLGLW